LSATIIMLPTVRVGRLGDGASWPTISDQAAAVDSCLRSLRASPASNTSVPVTEREQFLAELEAAAATLRRLAGGAP
jgi:hypothetical protein